MPGFAGKGRYCRGMTTLSRRSLLRSAAAGAGVALTGSLVLSAPAEAEPTTAGSVQFYWRYCGKCHVMFFDGYPAKGVCAGAGGHASVGFYFSLPYDVAANGNAQSAWRYCGKCQAMFFNGYADKGRCPAGAGHSAAGFNFVLPHDVSPSDTAQADWRYCRKCHVMFFDGYEQKGLCPAGGGHWAQGFLFVLPHV
jgi:hypothetical protein